MNLLKHLTILIASLALLASASAAFAADTITLTNGEVIEGEIVEETDEYVVIRVVAGGIERTVWRVRSEIESIVREGEADGRTESSPEQPARPQPEQRPSSQPRDAGQQSDIPDGATRVAFLRTSNAGEGKDMVGPYLNGQALSRAADILRELPENERPDIVVLEIDSGGGAVAELDDIINAIQNDLKKDFRVVAWIRYAISGAAFTAMNAEEIVFMSSGQLGGNVAYIRTSSGTQADRGDFLDVMIEYGRRVARNGRIDPKVMWAMQKFMTLSADIDEDGRVTWYDDDRGEYMVSPQDKILTLNALDAVKFKIAKGIADNKNELMDVLGVTEWVETGHEADEYLRQFRDDSWTAQARMNELFTRFIVAVQLAAGAENEQDEGEQVGKARRVIGQLKSYARRVPALEKYQGLTPEFFREIEELLREQKYGQILQMFGVN